MAKLYFKYGAMGSSKSAQALMTKFNYEEKDRKVWLIKPSIDTRDGSDTVYSRIGLSAKAQVISPQDDIYEMFGEKCRDADVVISDESQFFTEDQIDQLRRIVDECDIPVLCSDLAAYRQAMAFITREDVCKKTFKELAPAYAERNGGYTRIVRTGVRRGDAAETAMIELV